MFSQMEDLIVLEGNNRLFSGHCDLKSITLYTECIVIYTLSVPYVGNIYPDVKYKLTQSGCQVVKLRATVFCVYA